MMSLGKINRRHFINFDRYSWKKQYKARVRQFIYRLVPLVLILVLSTGFIWIFRNANLRNHINDSAFKAVTFRTFQTVENYFTPMFEIISSAILWGEIGEINSIGSPENYIDLLRNRLKSIGTVSSLSITDTEKNELVLVLSENRDSSWYVTEKNTGKSLSKMRIANGIEYQSLNRETASVLPQNEPENFFRISKPYLLPLLNTPGITLLLETSGNTENTGITLCLDLPLSEISKILERAEAVESAVILILMPLKEDFIFLPVDSLLKPYDASFLGTKPAMPTPLEDGVDRIIDLISSSESNGNNIKFKFTHKQETWLTEFKKMEIGLGNFYIGTLIPEKALWTAQFSGPFQIFMLALIASTGFLLFRLIHDYRSITQSPERVEEMIRAQISEGESSQLEFKSSLRWDYHDNKINKELEDVIVKSIAAFNNADGGTLFLGVADSGEILGIENDYQTLKQQGKDYFEIHLRNLLSSKYGVGFTSKNITIDFPLLSGLEICRIRIRRGRQPLFTTVKTKSGTQIEKFYIRSGNTSQILENPSEITEYIYTRFSTWRVMKGLTSRSNLPTGSR